MERLSPLDATFLYVEDGVTHMHIASCAILEGPPPPWGELVGQMTGRLGRVPRYRQVVRFVPLQLGRPVWVDDDHFCIDDHVRRAALPSPGGKAELCALMGLLMSEELDRHRPLWQMWVVEGLEDGRWAVITKVHHCMADGVAGTDLISAVFDREPLPPSEEPDTWEPAPTPSGLRLLTDAAAHLVSSPSEQLRALRRTTRAPRRALAQLRDIAGGVLSYVGHVLPTPSASLVGGIGPYRRWTWVSADLDDLKRIGRASGATVNDVVLAVITGGFRELVLSRGEPVDHVVLRSLVPVSVRTSDERGIIDNRVSAMLADLPVSIADPSERLDAVTEQLGRLKRSHQASAGEGLTMLATVAPTAVIAFAERAAMEVMRRLPQHSVNTVTTNVPGPPWPLYFAGCRVLELLPYVPISYGVRVGVAILSYNGRIAFGVTGDDDTAPDIDVLARGIEDGITELVKLIPPGS